MTESPADWIPRGGRPAATLDWCDGMPAYESDDGRLVVFETLVAFAGARGLQPSGRYRGPDGHHHETFGEGRTIMLPLSYGQVAVRQAILDPGSGLVPLHDQPGASWSWRPLLWQFRRLDDGGVQRFGSQNELDWRNALAESTERSGRRREAAVRRAMRELDSLAHADELPDLDEYLEEAREWVARWEATTPWRFTVANERARATLLEHLDVQQRIDLAARGRFLVRGRVNQRYQISPGNGLAIVDAETLEPTVSLCLHPERWIPHDDVALAHKLLIESGERGERELLDAARPYPYPRDEPAPRANATQRRAWEMERWLDPLEVTPA